MQTEIRGARQAAIHASPNAEPLKRRAFRGLAIGVIASLVLTLMGALGTDQAGFGLRLLYWFAVILPGSLFGLGVTYAVQGWGGLARHRWREAALVAVLVAVPHTFVVIVASALMFGLAAITPPVVAEFGFAVLLLSGVLTTINYLAARPAEAVLVPTVAVPVAPEPPPAPAPQPPPPAAMPSAFAERLPLKLRAGRLWAIEAEDHYLRVHTDLGSDLVLMRMADAAALLEALPGARVHRSWWVAKDAVTGSRSRNGDVVLEVEGGLEVPVSRGAKARLAAAGWF